MEIEFIEPKILQETRAFKPSFSPDYTKIAFIGRENEIYVIDSNDFHQIGFILCPNKIEEFYWSPDCQKILVLAISRNQIFIYNSTKNQPKNQMTPPIASLSGGLIETERVLWAPSSEQILIFGVYSSQLLVWDFKNGKSSFKRLPPPKNSFKSVAFSPEGSILAVLNRNKNADTLTLFNSDFVRKTSFSLSTLDAECIKWSPNGQYIVVKDSRDHHLIEVVDIQFNAVIPYAAYEGFLGVNEVSISPNSVIIALGSYDSIIRLRVKTGNTQWNTIEELTHSCEQKHPSVVFSQRNGFRKEAPFTLEESDEIDSKGFSLLEWSYDNTFLAVIVERMPQCVFIWNTKEMAPQVVDLQENVTSVKWSPISNDCLIASDQDVIIHWNQKDGVDYFEVGDNVDSIEWSKDGTAIIASDSQKGSFIIGNIPQDQ